MNRAPSVRATSLAGRLTPDVGAISRRSIPRTVQLERYWRRRARLRRKPVHAPSQGGSVMKVVWRSAVLGALALAVTLAFGTVASAQGPNKCLGGKNKCASKKMQGLLKCYNKAASDVANQDGVFTTCRDKTVCKYDGVT